MELNLEKIILIILFIIIPIILIFNLILLPNILNFETVSDFQAVGIFYSDNPSQNDTLRINHGVTSNGTFDLTNEINNVQKISYLIGKQLNINVIVPCFSYYVNKSLFPYIDYSSLESDFYSDNGENLSLILDKYVCLEKPPLDGIHYSFNASSSFIINHPLGKLEDNITNRKLILADYKNKGEEGEYIKVKFETRNIVINSFWIVIGCWTIAWIITRVIVVLLNGLDIKSKKYKKFFLKNFKNSATINIK